MGEEAQDIVLRDFLYKDLARLNSLFAQLFRGNVTGVSKAFTNDSKNKRGLKGSVHVVGGEVSSEERITESLTEQIDPHDYRIVELMDLLNLPVYHGSIPDLSNGQIVLVKGRLTIRNFSTIKSAFGVIPYVAAAAAPKKDKKSLKEEEKALEHLLKLIPFGMEIELSTPSGSFIGTIQEEYLAQSPNDLLRIYGTTMPGEWYVLGIADPAADAPPALSGGVGQNDLRKVMDELAAVITTAFTSPGPKCAISPVFIYRELNS